jgi:hypothetical protein
MSVFCGTQTFVCVALSGASFKSIEFRPIGFYQSGFLLLLLGMHRFT